MSKRILIGLLAVSVLAIWGNAANAFNRINGIILRHSSVEVEVTLCGDPLQNTELTLVLVGKVELTCENPGGHVPRGNPGHPTFPFTFQKTKPVTSNDFTTEMTCDSGNNNNATATIPFTFNFPSGVKCKKKWTKVNSELISVAATATWSCTGTGPECQNAGDTIETVRAECTDLEVGDECDRQGDEELQHVGDAGQPPPPLVDCADIHLHCDPNSPVLETVCGAGVHDLMPDTAANISYVTFQGDTSSVVLHHCHSGPLSGETLEIIMDTNLCDLPGGCCGAARWNDEVCAVEIKIEE
jgi:hypothetical protein